AVRLRAVPARLGTRAGADRERAADENRAGCAAAGGRRSRDVRSLRTAAECVLRWLGQAAALDGRHARPDPFHRTDLARDAAARIGRRDAGSALGVAALARRPDAAMGARRAARRISLADRAGDRRIGRRLDAARGAALRDTPAGAGPMEPGGAGFQRHPGRAIANLAGQYGLDRGLPARGAADAGLSGPA